MPLPRPCRAQPQLRHPNQLGFVPQLALCPWRAGGSGLPPAFDPANKAPNSSRNPCAVAQAAASLPGSPRSRAGPEDTAVLRRSRAACPHQGGRDVLALGTLLAVPGAGDRSATIAPAPARGSWHGVGYGNPQGLKLERPHDPCVASPGARLCQQAHRKSQHRASPKPWEGAPQDPWDLVPWDCWDMAPRIPGMGYPGILGMGYPRIRHPRME